MKKLLLILWCGLLGLSASAQFGPDRRTAFSTNTSPASSDFLLISRPGGTQYNVPVGNLSAPAVSLTNTADLPGVVNASSTGIGTNRSALATTAGLASGTVAVQSRGVRGYFPLTLPTYDGLQWVTHPSVLDAGTNGFGGHRYWLGYTPYPGTAADIVSTRENPAIAFSDDLLNWGIPPTTPNPLFTYSECLALRATYGLTTEYVFWADSEIFINTNSGKLVMSGKWDMSPVGTPAPTVWFIKESTDGTNWSALTPIYTNSGSVCQQVVDLGTGLRWFYGQSGVVKYVDSTYAYVFNVGSEVTTDISLWHFDVKKAGANYWILGSTGTGGNSVGGAQKFAVSANGSTWTVVSSDAVKYSGYDWDGDGYYKPDFLVNDYATTNVTLFGGSWQRFPTSTAATTDYLNTNTFWRGWRIGVFRDIILPSTTNHLTHESVNFGSAQLESAFVTSNLLLRPGSFFAQDQFSRQPSSNLWWSAYVTMRAGATDVDARNFCRVAGITDMQTIWAVNGLVLDLKSANLWTNDIAIYPFVGGTSNSTAINLKNPATNNIVFTASGVTYSASGIKGNGSSGWGDTGVSMLNNGLTTNSARCFMWLWNPIDVDATYAFGAGGAASSNNRFMLRRQSTNTFLYTAGDAGAATIGAVNGGIGATIIQRTNLTQSLHRYQLTNDWSVQSVAGTDIPDRNMGVLAYNNGASPSSYSQAGLSGFSIGYALTSAQYTNYFNAWSNFQAALGR